MDLNNLIIKYFGKRVAKNVVVPSLQSIHNSVQEHMPGTCTDRQRVESGDLRVHQPEACTTSKETTYVRRPSEHGEGGQSELLCYPIPFTNEFFSQCQQNTSSQKAIEQKVSEN